MGFYEDRMAEAEKRKKKKEEEKQAALDMLKNPVDGGKLAITTGLDVTNEDKQKAEEHLSSDEQMQDIKTKKENNVELAVSEKFAEALQALSPSALAFSLGGHRGSKIERETGKAKANVLVREAESIARQAAVKDKGGVTPYQQASLALRRQELGLQEGREGRLGEHFDWKKGEKKIDKKTKLVDKYNKDPVVSNIRQSIVAGQSALELIQTGVPLGDKSVRVAIARLVGDVGRLSDFDIQQYTGNMSAARRAGRMLKEMWDGNLPKQDREEFGEFISKVLTTKKNQLNTETQIWAKRANKVSNGQFSEKDALELLQPTAMVDPKERMNDTPTRYQRNSKTGLWRLTFANGQTMEVTKEVAQQLTGR